MCDCDSNTHASAPLQLCMRAHTCIKFTACGSAVYKLYTCGVNLHTRVGHRYAIALQLCVCVPQSK